MVYRVKRFGKISVYNVYLGTALEGVINVFSENYITSFRRVPRAEAVLLIYQDWI